MRIKFMFGASALALSLMIACGGSTTNSNTTTNTSNTNTRASVDSSPTAAAAEYVTQVTEDNGVRTETRTYSNNPNISKVVITTRSGKRTATVYNASGEQRELHTDDLDDILRKSGNDIAKAAGFVGNKAEEIGSKTVEGGKTVVEKTGEGAKTVGEKTAEGAKTVGQKTAEGAKTVGEKTVEGAKKTGKAIKNAVTP